MQQKLKDVHSLKSCSYCVDVKLSAPTTALKICCTDRVTASTLSQKDVML